MSEKSNTVMVCAQRCRLWFNPWKPGFALVATCIILICGAARAQVIWERSYEAGSTDTNGAYMGGSQMMHLVPYRGSLYAGLSYWMDRRNDFLYGAGTNVHAGWGQVLRLDSPDGQWEVDLEMGAYWLRPETLKAITFNTDSDGIALPQPRTFLFTCNYTGAGGGNITVHGFARNDSDGNWTESTIYTGPSFGPESYSVRDIHIHRDTVTGVDRAFLTIGTVGILSGVYDASEPGWIKWDPAVEFGPLNTRPLAIVEANGSLVFSSGPYVYQRNDGINPTYTAVHSLTNLFSGPISSPIGGIRGLTTIDNPSGPGDSLLFVWTPDSMNQDGSFVRGDIYRLDPDGGGGYTSHYETTIGDHLSDYLGGSDVYFVLGGYNNFLEVNLTGAVEHIVGFESVIQKLNHPSYQMNVTPGPAGYYRGGAYAIRNAQGEYRIEEVNGYITTNHPPLVATVAYANSPFTNENAIYFSGLDPNSVFSTDHAWIYKRVIRPPAPRFDPQGWSNNLQIGFSGYTRNETLTNFPALITFDECLPDFRYADFASPSGGDLRFADAYANNLAYEIEEWNTNGTSYVWVNIPALSNSSDYITAYWGNSAETSSPEHAVHGSVWNSSYQAVWHLATSEAIDATSRRRNRTSGGGNPSTVTGIAGRALQFDGASDWIQVRRPVEDDMTVSVWLKTSDIGPTQPLWYQGDGVLSMERPFDVTDWGLVLNRGDRVAFGTGAADDHNTFSATGIEDGHWHYVVITRNQATGQKEIYIDGIRDATGTGGTSSLSAYVYMAIGANTGDGGGNKFSGTMDELWVQSQVMSSNWIWACWMQMSDGLIDLYTRDADGDGVSDVDEGIAGTDHTDADSHLALFFSSANGESISWRGVEGRYYTVQTTTNLQDSWTNVPDAAYSNLLGAGSILTYTNTVRSTSPRFFRIRVRN